MALKDKLMTLEDFKAVRDVDVASNSAQFTELKADLDALDERVEALEDGGDGLTESIKSALMDVVSHIGTWTDGNAQEHIDTLHDALYPPTGLDSISAVYTQSGSVYEDTALNSLKSGLVVTAYYQDATTKTLNTNEYALSGVLTLGTSTISVSYMGKTTSFTVTVSERWSYSINDLTKVVGTIGNNSDFTCGMAIATHENRRSFVLTRGVTSLASALNGQHSETSDYYLVKVPSGANTFKVSITPSTQYVQVLARELNNGVFSARTATGSPTGYQQGMIERTFAETAGDNVYIAVTTGYNSAASSYPVEPTGLDILFT